MRRHFNVEGACFPKQHYMVKLDSRLDDICQMVGAGKYFTINRARQYGKTTILNGLKDRLQKEYAVFFISLEGVDAGAYADATAFCSYFCGLLYDAIAYREVQDVPPEMEEELKLRSMESYGKQDFRSLGNFISALCSAMNRSIVLMIDEVDQASGYDIFLKFLGMLRDKYLRRRERPTFHSVILAGVHDIKNLKLQVRSEEEHQYNSPWNIAAAFNINMSFSVSDIIEMLEDYEQDCQTGMDVEMIAGAIYDYTSGYPFLVSRLCQIMDEQGQADAWTRQGFLASVKVILNERNTLFDDMVKKLNDVKELRDILYLILFQGRPVAYVALNHAISVGSMYGFLREENGNVVISNRIFETLLYNLFISEESQRSEIYGMAALDKNQFIQSGMLNMELILQKFAEHFNDIYKDSSDRFIEESGRRLFLLYLKPIINGTGNYYVEARTRSMGRTDIVIDYLGKQYVIEMKIWHGEEYNHRGEEQLVGYLEDYHLDTGYMVSFNFNKNKKIGVQRISLGDKTLIEVVV